MGVEAKHKTVREWLEGGPIGSTGEALWQEERLGFRIDAFLRSRGWEHTSSTPGLSVWCMGNRARGMGV